MGDILTVLAIYILVLVGVIATVAFLVWCGVAIFWVYTIYKLWRGRRGSKTGIK